MSLINWEQFELIELRTGTIIRAEEFPGAKKPAYQLWIDFGEYGIKKSSAQITAFYTINELIGKQIIGVINFPPKKIADFVSECLVTGIVTSDGKCVLLQPERKVADGLKVC
ncbi:tRNA-binding protein [Candidatus Dependentiae bacterium Noda2021]|nr:tRNA-binding protein [Candidatus Dependentiae bacterium Noda2021]